MSDKSVLAAYRNRLGKIPDQKVADQAGVSRTLVVNYRKKLGISAYQGHKGNAPTSKTVAENASDRPFRGRRSALDPYLGQLGSLPDAEIARLAGVTAENVRTYRQRRNIAPAWQSEDALEASPPPMALPVRTVAVPKAPPQAPAGPSNHAPKRPSVKSVAPAAAPARADGEPSAVVELAPEVPVEAVASTNAGTAFLVLVDTEQGPRSYALIATDIGAAATVAAARIGARHPDGIIRSVQRVAELLPL